jgi:hypothetical protein
MPRRQRQQIAQVLVVIIKCYFAISAGSAAVFAGKPGRYYRQDMSLALNNGLIEDWSKCIKTLSVSSREAWAHRLVDGRLRQILAELWFSGKGES